MNRIQALDGLRGVSIALVLLSHAGLGHVVPGGLGVTLFFFISGYIITRLLMREWLEHGRVDIPAFFLRRTFRIYPALLAYLAASTTYVLWAYGTVDVGHLAAAVVNVYNYYYLFVLDHGAAVNQHHPYTIVWSLAVEEHFYLLYPALAAAMLRRPARAMALLIAGCAVVLAWRGWLVYGVGLEALPPERIYKATDTRIDSIAWGVLFALGQDRIATWTSSSQSRWGHAGLCLGGLLMLLTLLIREENFRQGLRYTLQGMALYAMFWSLICRPTALTTWLGSLPLVWLGQISYSLYLWHWLVHHWTSQSPWLAQWGPWTQNLTMILMSLVLAHGSHRLIEQPGLALGRRMLAARARTHLK